MSKYPFLFILLMSMACAETSVEDPYSNASDTLQVSMQNSVSTFIDSSHYKYFELQSFDLHDRFVGDKLEGLKSLSQDDFDKYCQHGELKEVFEPGNCFYYSLQSNTTKEKAITIFALDNMSNHQLYLLVFNEEDSLLSTNILGGMGGYKGWSYYTTGAFTNDSTYQLTQIEFKEQEAENGEMEMYVDSVITDYNCPKFKNFEIRSEQEFFRIKKTEE